MINSVRGYVNPMSSTLGMRRIHVRSVEITVSAVRMLVGIAKNV